MSSVNYNSTYEPMHIVHEIHHLPHMNSHLKIQDSTFGITYDSQWNSYVQSLLALPIILLSIGLLAMLVFQMSLCFRWCFPCCKCLPNVDTSHQNPDNNMMVDQSSEKSAVIPRVRQYYIGFFVFIILAVGANLAIIFGSNDLVSGVQTSNNALNYVQDLFDSLVTYGDTLYSDGNTLSVLFTEAVADCPEASGLFQPLSEYFVYVEDYQSFVNPVPDQCSTASDELHNYGSEYKNSTMWSLWGSVMLGVGLYSIGLFFKSKLTLQLSVAFVQLLMLCLFLLCAVEMVIMMGLGDFCVEPSRFVTQIVPPDVQNITSYYVTCQGQNPMDPSIQSAETLVAEGQAAIQTLLNGNCQNNVYLEQSLVVLSAIDVIFSNVTTAIACAPTQSQFLNVLNDGLCQETFKGFYMVWLGQFFATAFLFFATIFVSLLYQFFDPHWDVEQQSLRGSTAFSHNSNNNGNNSHRSDTSNLLYMEHNPNDANTPSTSPNEFYYNTSSLHQSGDYSGQKVQVGMGPHDSL